MNERTIQEKEFLRDLRDGRRNLTDKVLPEFFVNPWYEPRRRYKEFTIPKKSGGCRAISAPLEDLKELQHQLAYELSFEYHPLPCVMGFVLGKSIGDNAAIHAGRKYVFNSDLKDFFPSIGMGRIVRVLTNEPYSFDKKEALAIGGICCIADFNRHACVLPQGAPTSPLLSNIVCEGLDRKLTNLARKVGARYTRYADDITFSSNSDIFSDGTFLKQFEAIVSSEGFTINTKKTRIQDGSVRQEVTGITVNKKPNVTKEFVRELRMLIHICEKYSLEDAHYRYCIHRYKTLKNTDIPTPNIESVILGKLAFMKMVKGENDPQYLSLKEKFRKCTGRQNPFHYTTRQYSVRQFEKRFNTSIDFFTKQNKQIAFNEKSPNLFGDSFWELSYTKLEDFYGICFVDGKKQFVWFSSEAAYYLNKVANKGLKEAVYDEETFILEQYAGDGRSFWQISLRSHLPNIKNIHPKRIRLKPQQLKI